MIVRKSSVGEAKARNYQKVRGVLSGENDLVFTWGIISAENPLGVEYPSSVNAGRDRSMREWLAQHNLEYIKVKGKYGNPENSLFVINPTLRDLEKLAYTFCQESFIYAVNSRDDGTFSFDAGYYEINMDEDSKARIKDKLLDDPEYQFTRPYSYKKTITKTRIIDQKGADDLFTSIQTHGRNFKFQIPFFEATIRKAYEHVSMCVEGKDRGEVSRALKRTTINSEGYTEGSIWRSRGKIYKV